MNVSHFFKDFKVAAIRYAPEILTGIGIAGMFTSTCLAVAATPKALALIEDKEIELSNTYHKDVKLTPKEIIKTTWKCYIPAAATGFTATACLVGACSANAKRHAALAAAYKLSETAFAEYKDKVVETIGERKEKTVREKVAQEQIVSNPPSKNTIYMTDKGDTLCYDYISKRYFKSDIEHIRRVENILNKRMLHDINGYVSLNEFYDELDLDRVEYGDELGWNTDELIDLDITPGLTDDEKPCIVVAHHVAPKYKYC